MSQFPAWRVCNTPKHKHWGKCLCVETQSTHQHTHTHSSQVSCVFAAELNSSSVFYYSRALLSNPTNRNTWCVMWRCSAQTNRERERCSTSSGLSALLSVCTSAEFVILDMSCLIKCKNVYSLPQQAWWCVNWSITLCQIRISSQLLDGSLLFFSGFEINGKKTFCLPLEQIHICRYFLIFDHHSTKLLFPGL